MSLQKKSWTWGPTSNNRRSRWRGGIRVSTSTWSMSEGAVEPEMPRLRKSASDKSAFAHFVAEEDAEVVEAGRPAKTWDTERRRPMVAGPEEEADSETDARADDFIKK